MKRSTHFALAMLVGTGFTGTFAMAADDDAKKEAGLAKGQGISEIQDNSGNADATVVALGSPIISSLSNRDEKSEVRLDFGAADLPGQTGFLIFHDARSEQPRLPGLNSSIIDDDKLDFSWRTEADGSFTPRAGLAESTSSGFLAPGEASLLSSFTPRSANAHLSLSYAPGDDDKAHKRLGIELSSSISVQPVQLPGGVSPSLAAALNRQEYNLGVNIGYWGFNLGASFKREYDDFSDGYEGFDIGLGYRGASWSTNLSVGEYRRRDGSLLGLAAIPFDAAIDQGSEYYAFGIGASYNFSRAFSLSGGFRHFEYGRNYRIDLAGAARSQIFYLGTHLNF